MHAESLAKAYVLTHGVLFTRDALLHAAQVNAKRQNVVYNLPADDPPPDQVARENPLLTVLPATDRLDRPQELFLSGDDGYTVCVSAVAPVPGREPATVDSRNGRLSLATPARPDAGRETSGVEFVPQPVYYDQQTRSGRDVRRWVSACGYDEMKGRE